MIRFSLRVCFIFSIVFFGKSLSAQVVFYGLSENPALFPVQNELEERNLISSDRVVLIESDSQTVCINRSDLGIFDTLISNQPGFPDDLEVKIMENCIRFIAKTGATPASYDLSFEYITHSGDRLAYSIRVDITEPLTLPFFDDFSYDSKYPDPQRWTDKNVFVNTTMAIDPPSIGVATFDGLNSNGTPYGTGFGRADYLTSAYLDLSDIPANDRVYLSYFLQARGNTYNHQLRDSIELEFKTKEGMWEKIASYKGINPAFPSTYVDTFKLYFVTLDPKYLYKGFQFRFVNYNYRLGVYSTWHLDYVKMIANQVPSPNLRDIAFMSVPNKILKRYSAIPYKQLAGHETDELANTTEIQLYNHFLQEAEDIDLTHLIIEELTTGTAILDKPLIIDGPEQKNPKVGINRFSNPFNPAQIKTYLASVPSADLPLIFRTTYSYFQDQEPPYLELNNRVQAEAEVGYVLAYDDGSAELNIAAEANNSVKSQIAVKYHLNVGDTLRAVQFHFPRLFDDVSKQLFNIKVWIGELKEEPDYYYQLQRPIYADAIFDTLQGFTTYPLVNDLTHEPTPLYIPPGDFYIGWQQFTVSSAGQFIPVGFDRNYEGGENLTYYKSTGDWKSLSELSASPLLKGIPMVRAKFQNALLTSATAKLASPNSISVYPNPSGGILFIESRLEMPAGSVYHIIDATGRRVGSGTFTRQIEVGSLSDGIYFLSVTGPQGQPAGNARFIKIR